MEAKRSVVKESGRSDFFFERRRRNFLQCSEDRKVQICVCYLVKYVGNRVGTISRNWKDISE